MVRDEVSVEVCDDVAVEDRVVVSVDVGVVDAVVVADDGDDVGDEVGASELQHVSAHS